MGQNNKIYLRKDFQICPNTKLGALVRSEFLIPRHVEVKSGLSFILQCRRRKALKIRIRIKKKKCKKVLKLIFTYAFILSERERDRDSQRER